MTVNKLKPFQMDDLQKETSKAYNTSPYTLSNISSDVSPKNMVVNQEIEMSNFKTKTKDNLQGKDGVMTKEVKVKATTKTSFHCKLWPLSYGVTLTRIGGKLQISSFFTANLCFLHLLQYLTSERNEYLSSLGLKQWFGSLTRSLSLSTICFKQRPIQLFFFFFSYHTTIRFKSLFAIKTLRYVHVRNSCYFLKLEVRTIIHLLQVPPPL